ncbi:MAG TPA: hypothetical protein VJX23_06590 [Candidatus Binataceae bacterium]|nr:hypothetical protein [Candidatus Binataceae bacterium]
MQRLAANVAGAGGGIRREGCGSFRKQARNLVDRKSQQFSFSYLQAPNVFAPDVFGSMEVVVLQIFPRISLLVLIVDGVGVAVGVAVCVERQFGTGSPGPLGIVPH